MRYDRGFGRYDREVFTAGPRHDRGFTAGNRYDREMYDAPYRRSRALYPALRATR